MSTSEFQHGVDVVQGTMLGGALAPPTRKSQLPGPQDLAARSHRTGIAGSKQCALGGGSRRQHGETAIREERSISGLESSNQLQVNARDSGPAKTVEGFETRHGAPVVGMQWHPEYMLPTTSPVEGETVAQTNSRQVNYQAIRYILEAGAAYRVRQDTLKAIRKHFGTGFVAAESKADVHFPEQTKGSGTRAVTPGPATARVPMVSNAKAVTVYLSQFKRTPPVLTWPEWTNLMNNRPLSQPPEPDQKPDYAALAQYLNKPRDRQSSSAPPTYRRRRQRWARGKKCKSRPAHLTSGIHDIPERAPGRTQKAINLGPLLRRGIAFRDDAVAEPRRLGAQSRVLRQPVFRETVEFGLQGGQAPVKIPGRMRFAFAVNDPPIQLAPGSPRDIKILGRDLRMPE